MDFPNLLWVREQRWNAGREDFAQYSLACLFLGHPPVGQNKAGRLSNRANASDAAEIEAQALEK